MGRWRRAPPRATTLASPSPPGAAHARRDGRLFAPRPSKSRGPRREHPSSHARVLNVKFLNGNTPGFGPFRE